MITYLRNNMGTPAVNGIIPTGLSFNDKGYTYDRKSKGLGQ
jgi:peptide/nickel transport system substrate-binding protein